MSPQQLKTIEMAVYQLRVVRLALCEVNDTVQHLSNKTVWLDSTREPAKDTLGALRGSQETIDRVMEDLKNMLNDPGQTQAGST